MMNNRTIVLGLVGVAVIAAVAFGFYKISQDANTTKPETTMTKTEDATKTQDTATQPCVRNFDPKLLTGPMPVGDTVEIQVKDFGPIVIKLSPKDAPKTVENFLRLTKSGYYDCVTFHRVAKNFVIQAGDPSGTGAGGQSAFGAEFADELNPKAEIFKDGYVKGLVAMANRGPNTNTSQFFIMLDKVSLPHSYTPFGMVVSGIETVDKIGAVAITPGQFGPNDGKPVVPVVISSAKIVGPEDKMSASSSTSTTMTASSSTGAATSTK